MANFKDRVEAEYEAIENSLSFLPKKPISQLSKLELAKEEINDNLWLIADTTKANSLSTAGQAGCENICCEDANNR